MGEVPAQGPPNAGGCRLSTEMSGVFISQYRRRGETDDHLQCSFIGAEDFNPTDFTDLLKGIDDPDIVLAAG
jgi:hypothetical protein